MIDVEIHEWRLSECPDESMWGPFEIEFIESIIWYVKLLLFI